MSRWPVCSWLLLGSLAAALAQAPATAGAQPSTPAGEYQALVKEFDAAREEISNAYARANTDEERGKVAAKFPQPIKYAPRFLALARKNPTDPAAIDALVWVAYNARGGAEAEEALKLLTTDYVSSDKLGTVCQSLAYSSSPHAETYLRLLLEKSPHKEIQGWACLSLGQIRKRQSETEAEKIFERVVADFGGVANGSGTPADAAKTELFEIRNLAIGKTAPEIEGEDLDGRKFKLSDYRGKVVVLDFWGDW